MATVSSRRTSWVGFSTRTTTGRDGWDCNAVGSRAAMARNTIALFIDAPSSLAGAREPDRESKFRVSRHRVVRCPFDGGLSKSVWRSVGDALSAKPFLLDA